MKDERDVTDLTVLIAPVVSDCSVFTFCQYGRRQIQQYIKIATLFVCHVWLSNNIPLRSITVLTQNCANCGTDRQYWAEINSLFTAYFLNTAYSLVVCCLYQTNIKCNCCIFTWINLSCTEF